ncbi:DUF805 domain-containing protein [Streptomyces sp. NL15-2K]|uniref:DUF805 domain-containing protein n=1 Tax=Streptomyces sp. NL15-2K TaxID=376149 RepID=UPI000F58C850|nr:MULTISPECIES: DUF805 domain-containing protein [Actinomycetes]WKX11531.1 DUF805 domain-containing protein [Kutzneria buriramensis]GCB48032.1 hypothetical protein SNL152K_5355 [Streptomyces sp. NL15-2K]
MSWFIEALKKYAVFSGRARRKEYWMYALFASIIYIALVIIALAAKEPLIAAVFYLAIILPSLAVTVRRLHDTSRTGWWVLIGMVPVVGLIMMLVFLCSDGEPGQNKYGTNPKEAPVLV